MKKFFSLVLALVMALSLTTVAWGATAFPTTTENKTYYGSVTRDVFVLTEDVTLSASVTLTNALYLESGNVTISATTPVTIDASAVIDAIHVVGGTLTLGANVTVTSTNGAIFWVENGGKLVIDGATVTSTGRDDNFYPTALVYPGGAMTVNSGSVSSAKTGAIRVNGGTLTVSGGAVYNSATETYSTVGVPVAVEVVASGTVTVSDDANVYSTTSSALSVDNASATISGNGEVKTTCENPAYCAAYARNGGVITVTGGKVDAAAGYGLVAAAGGEVTVAGGTVDGVKAHEDNAASATITGGTVTGDVSAANGAKIVVTGGTFSDDVSDYVAPGYSFVGGVVKATTSVGNTAVLDVDDLTVTDKLGANVPTTGITSIVKVAATTNKTTVDGKTTTTVVPAWYQVESAGGSDTFVECDKSVADLQFTFKGVGTVYVRAMNVPAAFNATPVTLYTAPLKATCDKVGQDNDVYVIVDGKYYATDPTVVDGAEKYALLSNGKMVVYYGEATAKPHNWAQATKNTYDAKTGAITSVKCPDCKNPIAVYAVPGTFDGKTYVQITDTDSVAYGYYFVAGTAANTITTPVVGGTTGGTVTSAATFDAGIAMYVGMSVMAAAGSAVVIGKKKD